MYPCIGAGDPPPYIFPDNTLIIWKITTFTWPKVSFNPNYASVFDSIHSGDFCDAPYSRIAKPPSPSHPATREESADGREEKSLTTRAAAVVDAGNIFYIITCTIPSSS
ncbi:hypothetical protein AZH53_00115 [Methanomicrobiaceae archaeon CYW5]|nr:hypothetical protein [Methanovulcanius yangii]